MALCNSITSALLNQPDGTIVLLHDRFTNFITLQIVYLKQCIGKKASPFKGSCHQILKPGIAESLELWQAGCLFECGHDHNLSEDLCSPLNSRYLEVDF